MPKTIDLQVQTPEQVPQVLRQAAQAYRESVGELQSSWGDEQAGKIWNELAAILERAAKSAENRLAKGY